MCIGVHNGHGYPFPGCETRQLIVESEDKTEVSNVLLQMGRSVPVVRVLLTVD